MPGEAGTDSLPEDKTELDSEVKLEVEILALAALERIAADIARRLKARVKEADARIILVSREDLAPIPQYQALQAGLDALLKEAEALLEPAPQEAALETTAALTAVQDALSGVAGILAFFRAETSFIGRSVTMDPAALQSALAGALAAQGFDVVLPEFIPLVANEARDGLLDRLARLRTIRVHLGVLANPTGQAAEIGPEREHENGQEPTRRDARTAAAVTAEIDSFLQALHASEGGNPSPFERAIAAAEAFSLLSDDRTTLWLAAKVLAAGGSYKTQRHLFTTLFTGSRLTYSGGAAVSFVAVDGRTSSVILADVLRDAIGHGRFRGHGLFWRRNKDLQPSNLLTESKQTIISRTIQSQQYVQNDHA